MMLAGDGSKTDAIPLEFCFDFTQIYAIVLCACLIRISMIRQIENEI